MAETEKITNVDWEFYFKVKTRDNKYIEAGIDFVPLSVIKLLDSKDFVYVKPSIVCLRSNDPDIINNKKNLLNTYGASKAKPFGLMAITPVYNVDSTNQKLIKESGGNDTSSSSSIVNVVMALPLVTGVGYNKHATCIDKYYSDLAKESGSVCFLREVFFAKQMLENEEFKNVCENNKFIDDILDSVRIGKGSIKTQIPIYDGYIGEFKFINLNCYTVLEFSPYMKENTSKFSKSRCLSDFNDSIISWYNHVIKSCKEFKKAIFAGIKGKTKVPSLKAFDNSRIEFALDPNIEDDLFSCDSKVIERLFLRNNRPKNSYPFNLDNWLISFIFENSLYNMFLDKFCITDKDMEATAIDAVDERGDIDEHKLIHSPDSDSAFTKFEKLIFIQKCSDFLRTNLRCTNENLKNAEQINNALSSAKNLICYFDIRGVLLQNQYIDEFSVQSLNALVDLFKANEIDLFNADSSIADVVGKNFKVSPDVMGKFLIENKNLARTVDTNTERQRKNNLYRFGFLPLSIQIENKNCFLPAWYNPISKCLLISCDLIKRLMFSLDGEVAPAGTEFLNRMEAFAFSDNTKINFCESLIDEIIRDRVEIIDTLAKKDEVKAFIAVLSMIMDAVKEYDKALIKFTKQGMCLIDQYLNDSDDDLDLSDKIDFMLPCASNKCYISNAELLEIDLDEIKYDKSVKSLSAKNSKEDKEYILNDLSCLLSPSIDNDATITAIANAVDDKNADKNVYKFNEEKPATKVPGAILRNNGSVSIETLDSADDLTDNSYRENTILKSKMDEIIHRLKSRMFSRAIAEIADYRIFYLFILLDKIKPMLLLQKRQKLLREVSEIEGQIDLIKESSKHLLQQKDYADQMQQQTESFVDAKINSIAEQLNTLANIPQIGSISIDEANNWLIVSTKDDIFVKDERSELKYNLGRLCFCIPFSLYDKSYLRSKAPCDLRWIAYKHKKDYLYAIAHRSEISANDFAYGPFAVVHGYSDGSVCLGDSQTPLRNAMTSGNLVMLVMLMLQYAESMNPKDTWGRRCHRWRLKQLDLKEYLSTFFVNEPLQLKIAHIIKDHGFESSDVYDICDSLTASVICNAFDYKQKLTKNDIVEIISELDRKSKLGSNTSCLMQYIDYLDIDTLKASYMLPETSTMLSRNPYGGIILNTSENNQLGLKSIGEVGLKLKSDLDFNDLALNTRYSIGLGYFGEIAELIKKYPCLDHQLIIPIPNLESEDDRIKLGRYLTYSCNSIDKEENIAYKCAINRSGVNYGTEATTGTLDYMSPVVAYMNILGNDKRELGLNVIILPKPARLNRMTLAFFFATKDAAESNGINTSDMQNQILEFIKSNRSEICNKLGFLEEEEK